MPTDKQPKPPVNKPITPALSSRFRNAKTPIAPRLAGSPVVSPATTVRRDLREQALSPAAERKPTTPLNNNVTPRSDARNNRISTESTPNTPIARRLSGGSLVQSTFSPPRPGSSFQSPNQFRLTTKASTPILSTARRISGSSNASTKVDDAKKFFRANEAKSVSTVQSPKSTLSPRPLATSFLRNGSPRAANSAPPSGIHTRNEKKDESFVRTDEAHVRATRPLTMARKQSSSSMTSTMSTNAHPPQTARTRTQLQTKPQPATQTSPSKTAQNRPAPPQPAPKPTQSISSPALVLSNSPSDRRRSFGSTGPVISPIRPSLHKKSASISSFRPPASTFATSPVGNVSQIVANAWMSPTVTIPVQHGNFAGLSPETLSPRSVSLASSKTIATSVTSDTDISEVSKGGISGPLNGHNEPLSSSNQAVPSPNTPLAQAQLNAANARRERKVLDLEISNSSLLAINKTLEKELRKQSAELRRFRRLSRSGRLSFAPSNRSVSIQSAMSLDTLQEQTEDDNDFSEEEDDPSEPEELDDELDVPAGDSPGETSAHARRRARDERRLMLDLEKHQQLLVDSQKLTQSIKKCLNISEDLIKEGHQALKYKVGIGDVQLGGRVLTAEEIDADHELLDDIEHQPQQRQGLLSPSLATMNLQEASLWLTPTPENSEEPDNPIQHYEDFG